MPSLITNCLARLVKDGRVSPKAAKDAEGLYEGMQGRLGRDMGAASAEAVGALEAARVMAAAARERKIAIGKQTIAFVRAQERMNAHPRGAVAGLAGQLSRDIFEKGGGIHVDGKTEVVFARLEGMFGPGNEALGSKFAGLRQDKNLARLVIRENFGDETANGTAKQISNAWKAATDYAATRAKAGGKQFAIADDWRQPQFWEGGRVKKFGEAEFTADIVAEMERGAVRLMDKETGGPAARLKEPAILKGAYHDMTSGGGRGGAGLAFSPEMRVFRFTEGKAGADAYLRLMEKYGPGTDLYAMLRGHLHSASREIAFIEQFGPDYRATFRALHTEAAKAQTAGKAKTIPLLSSAYGIEKTFKMLTGELNAVQNEALSGIMAGGRAWLTAVQLGGATLSAVPGDSATMVLASGYNRIPAAKVIAKAFELTVADTATKRATAARLGVVAYAAADTALTQARFADEWLGPGFTGKVANSVIRLSGLQAWTEAAKRAATMELLAYVGEEVGRGFNRVSKPFRAFLDRYAITAAEWDTLRAAPLLDVDGARFFDVTGVADQTLADKLMNAIVDERHFFVLEPTAMERAVLTPSAPRGTLTGELARSFGMYKSFAVTMLTTHMMRAAMQRNLASKAGYALALAATSTMFGAVAIGAKDMVAGKDPRRMNDKSFWLAALIQGGGLGILGDLLYQGFTRADTSLAGALGGPLMAAIDAGGPLVFPQIGNLIAGDETNIGASLARQLRKYLNPTPFYLKTAVDRLFFDEIQTLYDPQYRKSFRRIEQTAKESYGTKFWWAPGDSLPARGPNLGNVVQ